MKKIGVNRMIPAATRYGQDHVVRALLHVPEGPVRRGQPDDDEVDADQADADLDGRAADDTTDRFADLIEDVFHAPGRVPPCGVSESTDRCGPVADDVRRSVAGAADDLGRARAASDPVRPARVGPVPRQTGGSSGA